MTTDNVFFDGNEYWDVYLDPTVFDLEGSPSFDSPFLNSAQTPPSSPSNETKITQQVADAHLQQMPKRTMTEAELSERTSPCFSP